jgi:hypothetical protein
MPQSLSKTLVHLTFSTKHRERVFCRRIAGRCGDSLPPEAGGAPSQADVPGGSARSSSGTRLRLTSGMCGTKSVRSGPGYALSGRGWSGWDEFPGRCPGLMSCCAFGAGMHGRSRRSVGGASTAEKVQTPGAASRRQNRPGVCPLAPALAPGRCENSQARTPALRGFALRQAAYKLACSWFTALPSWKWAGRRERLKLCGSFRVEQGLEFLHGVAQLFEAAKVAGDFDDVATLRYRRHL